MISKLEDTSKKMSLMQRTGRQVRLLVKSTSAGQSYVVGELARGWLCRQQQGPPLNANFFPTSLAFFIFLPSFFIFFKLPANLIQSHLHYEPTLEVTTKLNAKRRIS